MTGYWGRNIERDAETEMEVGKSNGTKSASVKRQAMQIGLSLVCFERSQRRCAFGDVKGIWACFQKATPVPFFRSLLNSRIFSF